LDAFHAEHPDVGAQINVTRHPYSFRGDDRSCGGTLAGACTPEGEEPTWHHSLLGYMGGSADARAQAEQHMYELGLAAGVKIDYNVQTNWQPVNSQRLMLWAARFGKQEVYMDALGKRHFEQRSSASHSSTLLDVIAELGLSRSAAEQFLQSDELEAEVWRSYGSTIREKGIHAIPFFVFNSLTTNGGPFRNGNGKHTVVRGSGDPATFKAMLEEALAAQQQTANSRTC